MHWIKQCLDSCTDYPVVVVDNKSTDQTIAYIKKNYPTVQIFAQKENLGFGQGNNVGISYALSKGATHCFLLNQDAYLQDGCIAELIKVQIENPQYGIVSPIHLNGKGNKLDKNFCHFVSVQNNEDFYPDYFLKKIPKAIYEMPFINAAGWLLSKKILETVGGFDPIFFHYAEDENYCHRALFHNFKIGVVPKAFLRHDREDKIIATINWGSSAYLKSLERQSKLKYANINVDGILRLDKLIQKKKKNILKSALRLKFENVAVQKKELRILKNIKPEILESRRINILKAKNYLT